MRPHLTAEDLTLKTDSPKANVVPKQSHDGFFHAKEAKLPLGAAREQYDESSYAGQVAAVQSQAVGHSKTAMAAAGGSRAATSKASRVDEVIFQHRTGLPRGTLAEIGPPKPSARLPSPLPHCRGRP